jgi:hypothetical protein
MAEMQQQAGDEDLVCLVKCYVSDGEVQPGSRAKFFGWVPFEAASH